MIFKGAPWSRRPRPASGLSRSAQIIAWPLDLQVGARTDDQGRFEFMRNPGEMVLYAYEAICWGPRFRRRSPRMRPTRRLLHSWQGERSRVAWSIRPAAGEAPRGHWCGHQPAHHVGVWFQIIVTCDEHGGVTFNGVPLLGRTASCPPAMRRMRMVVRLSKARTAMPFDVLTST